MNENEKKMPQRNHVVTIVIGADDAESVMRAVKFLGTDFYMHGVRGHILGGPDYGMTVDVQVNEDITHDSFFSAVDEYLDKQREDDSE